MPPAGSPTDSENRGNSLCSHPLSAPGSTRWAPAISAATTRAVPRSAVPPPPPPESPPRAPSLFPSPPATSGNTAPAEWMGVLCCPHKRLRRGFQRKRRTPVSTKAAASYRKTAGSGFGKFACRSCKEAAAAALAGPGAHRSTDREKWTKTLCPLWQELRVWQRAGKLICISLAESKLFAFRIARKQAIFQPADNHHASQKKGNPYEHHEA